VRNVGSRVLATVVLTGLVSALTLSEVSASAATGAVQGVTSDSVKVGFIHSKTGVASATWGDSDVGCKARVGRENANGGVNGRSLDVQYVDDQSSVQIRSAASRSAGPAGARTGGHLHARVGPGRGEDQSHSAVSG
jgi:branched-chain amino acid transport system substrate-binding protein